jgi:hypothetical protein
LGILANLCVFYQANCEGEANSIAYFFNVCGSVHHKNILIYIQQGVTLHNLFYLEAALHVLGGTITYQECKQLYLKHLVFVTRFLLSATIVEELELVWVCCGWRTDLFCFDVVADVSMVSMTN